MKYLIVGMLFGMIINNAQNTGRILDLINKNHTEIKVLLQADFRESLKKAKSNRIKKGDELR